MFTKNRDSRDSSPGAMRHVRMEQFGGDVVLSYRRRQWSPGCFLMFWLAGWTVGCVMLIGAVLKEQSLFMLVFAIPFWASWFFVAFLLANMLLRVEVLRVGRWGLSYEKHVLFRVASRQVALDHIRSIGSGVTRMRSNHEQLNHLVRIETVGNPLEIFAGIDVSDREKVIELLESRLTDRVSPPDAAEAAPADAALTERPADTSIVFRPSGDELEFAASGRVVWPVLGFVTFICLFWNSIVSVFVVQLFRQFEWALFFFLIPFEVIGLCMLGVWLAVVSMPLWRHSWNFTRNEIILQFRVAGVGFRRTRRIAVSKVAWFDVRRERSKPGRENDAHIDWRQGRFMLVLLDTNDRELGRIGHLTEGEANWMAAEATRFYSRG